MSRTARTLVLLFGVAFLFAAVVVILLHAIPGPHRHVDYLVIGAIATFTSMLALFVILITTWIKSPDVFFKRRGQD